jgi:uncharacterized membrane protein
MPTAAKLICAILMCALGYGTSVLVIYRILPEGANYRGFAEVNAVIGFAIGWRMLGRMVGERMVVSVMNGMLAALVLFVLGLAVQAFYEMIQRALDIKYDSPGKALNEMLELAAKFAVQAADPGVMAAHFGAAALIGLIGHAASRRWR